MTKVIGRGMSMIACATYVCTVYNTSCICAMLTALKGMWKKKAAMMGMSQRRNRKRCVTFRYQHLLVLTYVQCLCINAAKD